MHKFLAIAVAPLFTVFLFAQSGTVRTETTKTTTIDGTLVDSGCQSTHVEHKETTTSPDGATATRTSTRTTTDCPVTTTTTSFGVMTADGRFLRFDDPGNTRVVEVVRSNKDWNRLMSGHEPIKVHVVGSANGDTVVVESIR